MIVIRNAAQLKFGKAREAIALMKESLAIQKRALAGTDFHTCSHRCHRAVLHAGGTDGSESRDLRNLYAQAVRRQGVASELPKDDPIGGIGSSRGFHNR